MAPAKVRDVHKKNASLEQRRLWNLSIRDKCENFNRSTSCKHIEAEEVLISMPHMEHVASAAGPVKIGDSNIMGTVRNVMLNGERKRQKNGGD
jgi:hypothetical protein